VTGWRSAHPHRRTTRLHRVLVPAGPIVAAVAVAVVLLGMVLADRNDPGVRPASPDRGETTVRGADLAAPADLDLSAAARAGPGGHRCRGVTIRADRDARRVMDQHPPGTTYCVARGVHRLARPLVPQRGDALLGRPGAVLNGSRVLSGWRRVEGGWSTSAHLPPHPSRHGECRTNRPECTFTEDVFLDDERLSRAPSAAEVAPGTFFADYEDNTITIGTDPGGRLVEQAVSPALVRSRANDVTVRGLVLEKAANKAQEAAVDGRTDSPRTGAGWRVVHNLVQLNHGVGVGIGTRGVVRANVIREQGQLGVSVWEQHVLVRDNRLLRNGTAGYDPDWEAGGLKAWVTEDVRIVGNRVHGNAGPGLWSDGGCLDTVYRRNDVRDNWGAGIQHEISYDARIVRNRVVGNGLLHKGWAWEAAISIQSSGGAGVILVERNEVSGGAHGVMVIESGARRQEWPAPYGPHVVRNVVVRRNTVALREGEWVGVVQDLGDHGVFRRHIRFRNNSYRLESAGQQAFAWKDDLLSWSDWHTAAGQDVRGDATVLP
jgi:hypothetical protein